MHRRDDGDAPARDGARGVALLPVGELVDDDDVGALVLHRLDHHLGLVLLLLHGEHARVADGVVRHETRPRDLHALVDDDDHTAVAGREQPR